MTQISEEKAIKLIQGRLAKFQFNMTEDDCRAFLTLLRAQGWKLTSRDATTEMLEGVRDSTMAAGSAIHTVEALWSKLWELA